MPFNNPTGAIPPNGAYFDTSGTVLVPIDGNWHELFTVDNVIVDSDRFYMGHFFGQITYNRFSGGSLSANSRNLNAYSIAWSRDGINPSAGGGISGGNVRSALKYFWLIQNPSIVNGFNPQSGDASWSFPFRVPESFTGQITFWAQWWYYDFFGAGGSSYNLEVPGSSDSPRGFYISDVDNGYPNT